MSGALTQDQIGAAFRAILGYEARVADVQAIAMLGGTTKIAAEYIWDHWMGEPDEPTLDEVTRRVEEAVS